MPPTIILLIDDYDTLMLHYAAMALRHAADDGAFQNI